MTETFSDVAFDVVALFVSLVLVASFGSCL